MTTQTITDLKSECCNSTFEVVDSGEFGFYDICKECGKKCELVETQ